MKKFKAVIFDLDGTLLDSRADIVDSTNATIVQMGGKALPEAEVISFVGHGVRDLISKAVAGSPSAPSIEETLKYFNAHYLEHCLDKSLLFDHAQILLDDLLARKVPMALFTNKPKLFADKIVAGLDLEKYFKIVIAGEGGYPNKPDSSGTHAILKVLGTLAEETLMVGDSDVDFNTAKNVGMGCALYLDGFTPRAEIHEFVGKEEILFEDFTELKKFF